MSLKLKNSRNSRTSYFESKKAYLEALEISQSNHGIFSLHGQYYVACYYYNQSNFIHSKKLIIKLLDSIEKKKNNFR